MSSLKAEAHGIERVLASISNQRKLIRENLQKLKLVTSNLDNGDRGPHLLAAMPMDEEVKTIKNESMKSLNEEEYICMKIYIDELKLKAKALEENLLTSATSISNLQDHVKSLRKEAQDVTSRSCEKDLRAGEKLKEKEQVIQTLQAAHESTQSDRDEPRSNISTLINEELLEEMR